MNERIRQLWEDNDSITVVWPETGSPVRVSAGLLEKFAELIVRQCMEEVMTYQHHRNPTREMVPFIVEDIKLHFGVEE
jgi:hypothetical protein